MTDTNHIEILREFLESGCEYQPEGFTSALQSLLARASVDPVTADNAKAADSAALAMIGMGYAWDGVHWYQATPRAAEAVTVDIEALRDIDRALALADKSNKIDRKRVVGMAVIKHIAAIRTALSARASAGEGGWPARWFASGPMGEFFTPNHAFAETLIRGMKYDRDDWTITDLSIGDTYTAAPQPARNQLQNTEHDLKDKKDEEGEQ